MLPFPALARFKSNIDTMPRIQRYLKSARFMPRNAYRNHKYVFVEGQFSTPPRGITPGMLVAGQHVNAAQGDENGKLAKDEL